ncbi:MAG: nucleotide-binding protein [Treponema sp.]|nr:nucleotide-binding protein [Treponema sp.]
MSNIFIGWSGNKSLADKIADLIANTTGDHAIVGGGQPKDMFIGAQVIDQINRCDTAIILAEDKNGTISPNLMFEWGYISAKYAVSNIHAFLLNKQSKDLPSDLMGSWVNEVSYDTASISEQELGEKILDLYLQNTKNKSVRNYFDLISDWKRVYAYLSDKTPNSNQTFCEYILSGCLAAYYYQDNRMLRQTLNNLKLPLALNAIAQFAKAYVDIFIQSENMSKPLPQQDYFGVMQVFETSINRQKQFSDDVELLLDILNYDAYSLANSLFLKNTDLDEETRNFCANKAKECLEKDFELLDSFEKTIRNNECLVLLLKSYLFNDIGHLYKDAFHDEKAFLNNLTKSVEYRKHLHQTFTASYPANVFLATKLEQEYIIALSEQCNYMENTVLKGMYKNLVISKFKEWEKELVYTSSLTDRIKTNIRQF